MADDIDTVMQNIISDSQKDEPSQSAASSSGSTPDIDTVMQNIIADAQNNEPGQSAAPSSGSAPDIDTVMQNIIADAQNNEPGQSAAPSSSGSTPDIDTVMQNIIADAQNKAGTTNVDAEYWNSLTPEQQNAVREQSASPITINQSISAELTAADQQKLADATAGGPAAYDKALREIYLAKGLTLEQVEAAISSQKEAARNEYRYQVQQAKQGIVDQAAIDYDQAAAEAAVNNETLAVSKEDYLASVEASLSDPQIFDMSEDEFVMAVMEGYVPEFVTSERTPNRAIVETATGDIVDKASFDQLKAEDQQFIMENGIDAYNTHIEQLNAQGLEEYLASVSEGTGTPREVVDKIYNESGTNGINMLVIGTEYKYKAAQAEVDAAGGIDSVIRNNSLPESTLAAAGYDLDTIATFKQDYADLKPYETYEGDEFIGYDLHSYAQSKLDSGLSEQEVKSDLVEKGFDIQTAENVFNPQSQQYNSEYDLLADKFSQASPEDQAKAVSEVMGSTHSEILKNMPFDELEPKFQEAVVYKWAEGEGLTPGLISQLWNTGKYFLPVYGTVLTAQERGLTSGWTIASGVGDALIIAPVVRGVSISVKAGKGIGSSILRETLIAARGEITGPAEAIMHPRQTIASVLAPFASFVPGSKTLPLASFYRGTYSEHFSISKVGSSDLNPMVVRQAVEDAQRAMINGSKSGKIELEGGQGYLHYSSAGIQSELPGTVLTATPYAPSFKSGLVAEGEGVYTAPSAYLGLENATAYGKEVHYGFNGDEFLGVIDDNFNLLNDHGRVIGKIDLNSVARDADGDIILKNNTKIINDQGAVIGKTKKQPAFVLIHTDGMQVLPEWAEGISDINQLEREAWKHFSTGEHAEDLYPVFKQYGWWIEQEGLLPKGTHLIPVFDDKGYQVILKTKDAVGNTIEVPMMQLVDKNWLATARATTQKMKPVMNMIEPKMGVEVMLSHVTDLPTKTLADLKIAKITKTNRNLGKRIADWFRVNPDSRLVGSTVEYLHTGKYAPGDIDMGARNPFKAAQELADIIEDETGATVLIKYNGDGTARLEYIDNGIKKEIANIKHINDSYETTVIDGVRMETMGSQLERTLQRMEADFSGKGFMRFQRILKSAGHDLDLGIGAKAPSRLQLEKLRVKGWKNTITDIFNKDLRLDVRAEAARLIDDSVADDVADLVKAEKTADAIDDEIDSINDLRKAVDDAPLDENGRVKLNKADEDLLTRIARELDLPAESITERAEAVAAITRRLNGLAGDKAIAQAEVSMQGEYIRNNIDRMNFIEGTLLDTLYRVYGQKGLFGVLFSGQGFKGFGKKQVMLNKARKEAAKRRGNSVSTTSPAAASARGIGRQQFGTGGFNPSGRNGIGNNGRGVTGESGIRSEGVGTRGRESLGRLDSTGRITATADGGSGAETGRAGSDYLRRTPSRGTPSEPPRRPSKVNEKKESVRVRPGSYKQELRRKVVPEGSIAWASGFVWKYIPPPYKINKPITVFEPPAGAENFDSNKPGETIQIIGKAEGKIPKRIDVDLGWTDVTIVDGKEIAFTDTSGLETDIGGRLKSKTMGMSVRSHKASTGKRKPKKRYADGSIMTIR